ncbi:MAG: hypothetical protein GY847_02885 [Proteobacteria bacterium]|nr:hypothetical protein [Pseudomonadota bacterium]
MKYIARIAAVVIAGIFISACVTHRDTRTEIYNENTYLNKDFLTRPNPNHTPTEGEAEDYGWLMGLSVTAVSVPAPIGDFFPGLQADIKYVQFRFSQNSMQIEDAITPGPYSTDPEDDNLPDPREAQDLAPRILQEYDGAHVDIQLRQNLDGEITNFVEEFKERDWRDRQFFKAELDNGAFTEAERLYWYYNWAVSEAMTLKSTSLVPGSLQYVDTVAHESNMCDGKGPDCRVDWEKGDYIEWKVRNVFAVNLMYTQSLMNMRSDIDTQTIDFKYSLWRRPDPPSGSEYVARPIAEKDKYRRKFGIWDYTIRQYQDPETGLPGATMFLSRYNPRMPMDFYLVDVPKEYTDPNADYENKSAYDMVAELSNNVFEEAGDNVSARIGFHSQNEGGIPREFGDIRYSFVVWHNNEFTGIWWLGYGPSWIDPRTGEIINATLNFNNFKGLHYYTYLVRDLLAESSSAFDEGGQSCTAGERRPIDYDGAVKEKLHNTTIYKKLKSYMDEEEPQNWVMEHDEQWYDHYHMLLNDLRFFYPPYQTFVAHGRESIADTMHDKREELMRADNEFWEIAESLDSASPPWGMDDLSSPTGMDALVKYINRTKDSMKTHQEFQHDRQIAAGMHAIDMMEGPLLLTSVEDITQKCKSNGQWQTFEEWEDEIRWRIAVQISIHELGHNIGQYHNFYGSMDHLHYQPCTGCVGRDKGSSSSVMDYVHHFSEVGADLGYYPYDRATLIYGYRYDSQEAVDNEVDSAIISLLHPEWKEGKPDGEMDMSKSMLYANDYFRPMSPLVDTFDLGATPSQIVYNHIQHYDFMYKYTNFRAWRKYWETWNYPNRAFSATFPLRRFLELWALDFNRVDLENDLRILGVDEDVHFFDNLADEFNKEMGQATRLAMNFFRAILTQSSSERSYETTYDLYFGDVTRIGIIYDKLYAMFSFLGLWEASMYNPDLYALLAYYEGNWGSAQAYSDSLDTLTVMLGGTYDVYPWFLPNAVMLFAQDSHNISFSDETKKEWIGMRAFDRAQDMLDYFGFDPRTQCVFPDGAIEDDCKEAALGPGDDGHQMFHDKDGSSWTYVFLFDRNQHLCANVDMSPIAYKMIWDYNEDININRYESASTYTIKYFLDFYKYFEHPFGI